MATWQDSIDITVEVAFANDPLDASPTWTDISAYVGPWDSDRGRSSEYADFTPGTLRVTLRNDDRRFDPENTAGPYYGDLVPMKPIRVTAALGAFSTTVFLGYVLGWPQIWGNTYGEAEIVAVDGTRVFKNAPLPSSAYAQEVLADDPIHYWRFQDTAPFADDIGGLSLRPDSGVVSTVELDWPLGEQYAMVQTTDGKISTATLYPRVQTEQFMSAAPRAMDFVVEFEDGFDGSDEFSVFVLSDLSNDIGIYWFLGEFQIEFYNSADNKYHSWATGVGTGYDFSPGPHHFAIVTDPTYVRLWIDGVLRLSEALSTGGTTFGSQPGVQVHTQATENTASGITRKEARISHLAVYDTTLSAARVIAHYHAAKLAYGDGYHERTGARAGRALDAIGWPTARRTISTGKTAHGPYLPGGQLTLDYLRQLEAAEQGFVFFDVTGDLVFRDRQDLMLRDDSGVVFSDTGTTGRVQVAEIHPNGNPIETVRNIVTTSYASTGAITRRDTASITAYLEAREFVEAPTLPTGSAASNLSAYVLRLRKDPQTLVDSIVVELRDDASVHVPEVLGLEIGDVVVLEWTPMGVGAQITKRVMVQRIAHRVTEEHWTTTLYLSPPILDNFDAPYLTLGHATFGKIGLNDEPLLDEDGLPLLDENGDELLDEDTSTVGNKVPY